MSEKRGSSNKDLEEEAIELRRGPWTLEEDTLLVHYIACHGEGRWNLLARRSGLKRTGKSCRLRWLNYLKPDIKRGNLSPEEQLLILQLHSNWGNRWSRIAQHLPGRTDNEIKNYWRTRVQKQARQLKIDPNSTVFRDVIRCCWMPRLLEKISSSPCFQSFATNTPDMIIIDQSSQIPINQEYCTYASHQHQPQHIRAHEPSGGWNQSPSNSSETSSVISSLADFPSISPDELAGVTFDPFHVGFAVDDNIYSQIPASAPFLGYSTSDYTSSSINNCTNSNGDGSWSMDELHVMLKSYMNGMVESEAPLGA